MKGSIHLTVAQVFTGLGCALLAHAALAQDSAKPVPDTPECTARAGAPDWMPCGANRTLNESDVKAYIVKEGMVAKL